MLDPDHGQVELVAQAMRQPRDRLDLALDQAGGDLVEQQHPRPGGERHADLEQPLLRRRDRGGRQGRLRLEPEQREDARLVPQQRRDRTSAAGEAQAEATFAATLSEAKTRGVWKVRAMPCSAKRCGAAPARGWPSANSSPEVGATTPDRALKKVVLPAPFGPMMPTSSPGANAALTASTAVRPPKRTVSARASTSGWRFIGQPFVLRTPG
jgi:hypothetical protein